MNVGIIASREQTMSLMSYRMWLVMVATCAFVFWSDYTAVAQKKAGPARFVVDLVTLDSGKRLRGAFLDIDADGIVSMAVQRAWLEKSRPEMFAEVTRDEGIESELSATELRGRIQGWLDEKPESNALVAFLEVELERVQERLTKLNRARDIVEDSQFVVVKFKRREVEYSFAQSPENRRIAMLAWRERFRDVETRQVSDLETQLRRLKIDPTVEKPALADRLPPVRQDNAEWAARRSIVEYSLSGGLDFQGIGGALFRTDREAKNAGLERLLPELLPQLLQDQLGSQLADLLQEPGLNSRRNPAKPSPDFKTAIREAENVGVNGFRATVLSLNLQRNQVVVETRFLAKLPTGKWQPIWSHHASEDASKPRPDLQKRIETDPRIADAMKLTKSLGLGVSDKLDIAMGFGAATMEAQQSVDREFFRFLDSCVNRLDLPRLEWNADE